jgi:hypothetical protein
MEFAVGGLGVAYDKMVILASGNVGTAPGYPLTVANDDFGLGSGMIKFATHAMPWYRTVSVGVDNAAGGGSVTLGRSNATGAASGAITLGISNSVTSDQGIAIGISNAATNLSVAIGSGINNSNVGTLQIGPSNTAKVAIDAAGNVGIGTTAPSSILHVSKSQNAKSHLSMDNTNTGGLAQSDFEATSDAGTIAFGMNGSAAGNSAYVWNYANNALQFGTNNVERMRILAGGNVGIGTTAPAHKLQVIGGHVMLDNGRELTAASVVSGGYQLIGSKTGSDIIRIGDHTQSYSTEVDFFNSASANPDVVFKNGNVGIGTSTPNHALEISSGSSQFPVALNILSTTHATSRRAELMLGGNWEMGQDLHGNGTKDLYFYDNAAGGNTRLMIDTSGNVGIGTTTPSSKLEVAGQVTITGGSPGAGKVLTSDAAGLASWATAPAGSVSGLTAAAGTGTIDNTNYAQTWNWSTATTQSPLSLSANALTTGSLLNVTSSNAALNSTSGLLNVANTGASTTGMVARIQSSSAAGSGLTVLANGNVGIGTSTPSSTLDVNGTVSASIVGVGIGHIGGGDGYGCSGCATSATFTPYGSDGITTFNNNWGGMYLFKTANVTKFIIAGDNVGIGTNVSPSYLLDIAGTGAAIQDELRLQNNVAAENNAGSGLLFGANRLTSGLTNVARISGLITDITDANYRGALTFSTASNSNPEERVRIDSTGNVGIGTTSPSNLLTLYGSPNIQLSQSSGGVGIGAQLTYDQVGQARTAVGFGTASGGASYIILSTEDGGALTEKMRIDGSGNVGIGTSNPTAKVEAVAVPSLSTGIQVGAKVTVMGNSGDSADFVGVSSTVNNDDLGSYLSSQYGGYFSAGGAGSMMNSYGVYAVSSATDASTQSIGVYGSSPQLGVSGESSAGTGVQGVTNSGVAVRAHASLAGGFGLYSFATKNYFSGSVGIGTSSPSALLDVSASTGGIALLSRADTSASSGDTIGKLQFWNNDTELTTQKIFADIEVQAAQTVATDAAAGNLLFRTTGTTAGGAPTERMRIDSAGNVGIGTTAPGSALEVAGQVKITGGVPGAGKVLTSDAAGLASWTAPSAGSVSGLSAASASQTLANTDFSQTWNWDAVTAGSGLNLGSSSVTSGTLFNTASTSTAMTGTLGNFVLSGDNAANTGSVLKATVAGVSSAAVPLMVTNGGTGMSFRVNDNGSDSDATPFVVDNAGKVGIGTTSPAGTLTISGLDTSTLLLSNPTTQAGGFRNSPMLKLDGNVWNGVGGNKTMTSSIQLIATNYNGNPTESRLGLSVATDSAAPTEKMSISSTGNVGIGTTSPENVLHIENAATTLMKVRSTGAVGTGRSLIQVLRGTVGSEDGWDLSSNISNASDEFTLREVTSGSGTFNRLTILKGGNVGIGTTTPSSLLHVAKNFTTSTGWDVSTNIEADISGSFASYNASVGLDVGASTASTGAGGAETYGVSSWVSTGNDAKVQTAYGIVNNMITHTSDFGYSMSIQDSNSSTGGTVYGLYINLDNAATTRYGIYQTSANTNYFAGNVGIGTTAPTEALEVNANILGHGWIDTVVSNDWPGIGVWTSGTGNFYGEFQLNSSRGTAAARTATQANDVLGAFRWAGWGTSAQQISAEISAVATQNFTNTTRATDLMFLTSANASANSEKMRITGAGNVGIGLTNPTYQLQLSTDSAAKPGTSTWTIASDARLKDVRAAFSRGLDALEGINPIYFKYKSGNPLDLPADKEYVGIIAQDAAKTVPEAVQIDDRGYLHLTNDAIIWTILNAVKELYHKWLDDKAVVQSEIAALESGKADKEELVRLRAENEELKARLELENVEIKARLDRLEAGGALGPVKQ